jgi:hypothetical protein
MTEETKTVSAEDPVVLAKRMEDQRREALGPDNMWYAGLTLQHNPNKQEAGMHYCLHGGPEDFNRRHPRA